MDSSLAAGSPVQEIEVIVRIESPYQHIADPVAGEVVGAGHVPGLVGHGAATRWSMHRSHLR